MKNYVKNNSCPLNIGLIKKIMEQKSISKKMLCQECNISTSTLNRILRGITKPRISTLYNLSKFLNVSCEKLIDKSYRKMVWQKFMTRSQAKSKLLD